MDDLREKFQIRFASLEGTLRDYYHVAAATAATLTDLSMRISELAECKRYNTHAVHETPQVEKITQQVEQVCKDVDQLAASQKEQTDHFARLSMALVGQYTEHQQVAGDVRSVKRDISVLLEQMQGMQHQLAILEASVPSPEIESVCASFELNPHAGPNPIDILQQNVFTLNTSSKPDSNREPLPFSGCSGPSDEHTDTACKDEDVSRPMEAVRHCTDSQQSSQLSCAFASCAVLHNSE